jgi:hypothetical protein
MPLRIISNVFVLTLISSLAACQPASSGILPVTAIPTGDAVSPTATLNPTLTLEPTRNPSELLTVPSTSTPLPNDLLLGNSMQMAAATDTALQPAPRIPVSFDSFPVPMTFDEFYDGYNMRTGMVFSDKLVSLDGQAVMMEGYMAPPLKPELDFFVLTRVRLAFCPFCTTAGDWPDDIVLVYMGDQTTTATSAPIRIVGRLEVGASMDSETGMVSLVRIYADTLEILG